MKEILKYLTPGEKKSLFGPCSLVRIDCYGECLPKVLDEVAKCLEGHWLDLPKCVVKAIEGIEKECGSCVCQLLNAVLPNWVKDVLNVLDLLICGG